MNMVAPRALWIALHRYIGLVAMLFLGFAAITGSVLCFVRPLDAALNADLFMARPVSSPIAVPLAVDRYQAQHPELFVRSFPLAVARDRTIPVKIAPSTKGARLGFDQVFLDRADGHLVGVRTAEAAWNRRGAMELLHDVHYTLLAGDWGKWFMGWIAFAWLLGNIVGAYLTIPVRRPFWKGWKRMWRFRFRSALPRMLLDMHRSSGLWLFVPLLALAFTSVALNFFTIAYTPIAHRLVAPRPSPFDAPPPFPAGVAGTLGFTKAVATVTRAADGRKDGWRPATALYQPGRQLYGVTLTDDGSANYRLLGPVYYYVDGNDGRVVDVASPYDDTGSALTRVLYPVHSGRTFGAIGIALVFVMGLVTFGQCATGFYVWWKKRRNRVAAERARLS